MSIESSTTFTKILGSRKVCVINLDEKEYTEEFKGEKFNIPPMAKRSVFMPMWKARKFLASCDAPPAYDLTGEFIKGGKVKMLRIVELTEDEREKLGELTPEELTKKQMASDEKRNLTCGSCGFVAKNATGLMLHTSKAHPEVVAVE